MHVSSVRIIECLLKDKRLLVLHPRMTHNHCIHLRWLLRACALGCSSWPHGRPVVTRRLAAKCRCAPQLCRCCPCQVSDFGLSRLVSNEAPVIQTRTYGTVTHMPAELLIEGHMSKAADVYRCAAGGRGGAYSWQSNG
jgi:hypothetical protein